METHTLPPYPVESFRNAEKGIILMDVDIGSDGMPVDTRTLASTGFPGLDLQSLAWVKNHWRWSPPSQCTQITTRVSIKWDFNGASLYSTLYSPRGGVTPYDGDAITELLLDHH
jgi:outer membrane biosynthesis protein TonB